MKFDLNSPGFNRSLGIALLAGSIVGLNAVRVHKESEILGKENVSVPPFAKLGMSPEEWALSFSDKVGSVKLGAKRSNSRLQTGNFELVFKNGKSGFLPFSYTISSDGSLMNTIYIGKVAVCLESEAILYGILEACKRCDSEIEPKMAVFPDLSHESCVILLGKRNEKPGAPTDYKTFQLIGNGLAFVSNAKTSVEWVSIYGDTKDVSLKVYDIEGEGGAGGDKRPFVLRAPFDPSDCLLKVHLTTIANQKRLIQYASPVGDAASFRRACDLPLNDWPRIQSTLAHYPLPEEHLRGKVPELPAFKIIDSDWTELAGTKNE